MDAVSFFDEIRRARQQGASAGIFSVCSSAPLVLEAALALMAPREGPLLVEATANQVNQFGGYTGMNPAGFARWLHGMAEEQGFPIERLLLGGDHLGPLTWKGMPEAEAVPLAEQLVSDYVEAGFDKIHIDTSMKLADDNENAPLSDEVIARRGARLCAVAEASHARCAAAGTRTTPPVYVIGSEVPVPGGPQHEIDTLSPTSPTACRASISAFRAAFEAAGAGDAFPRVIAFVVQPGVEFTGTEVFAYNRAAARELCAVLKDEPTLVFEGHSTDYQPAQCLKELVEDGVAILKVGPALTYAMREALSSLEQIERVLLLGSVPLSDYEARLEHAMLADNSQWAGHYHGSPLEQEYLRRYSFHDRARYYAGKPEASEGVERLFENLGSLDIPLPLISRHLPLQWDRVQAGLVGQNADALARDYIGQRLAPYLAATGI